MPLFFFSPPGITIEAPDKKTVLQTLPRAAVANREKSKSSRPVSREAKARRFDMGAVQMWIHEKTVMMMRTEFWTILGGMQFFFFVVVVVVVVNLTRQQLTNAASGQLKSTQLADAEVLVDAPFQVASVFHEIRLGGFGT